MIIDRLSEYKAPLTSVNGPNTPPNFLHAQKYLVDRGIHGKDLQAVNGRIVPFDHVLTMYGLPTEGANRFAIAFPHYDLARSKVDWGSFRIIGEAPAPTGTGFGGWGKTFCPPKAKIHAWPHPSCDWTTGGPVDIYESVVKAMLGHKLTGRHSIGLNGVASGYTRNTKGLVQVLKDLPPDIFPNVRIIFDADAAEGENWQVIDAQNTLAAALMEKGHKVFIHNVPGIPGGDPKRDLNDMWAEAGDEATTAWLLLPGVEAQPKGRLAELIKLNTEVCLVRSTGEVYEYETGFTMSAHNFKNVNYSNRAIMLMGANGPKKVKLASEWLDWPDREVVKAVRYEPGAPAHVRGEYINAWQDDTIPEVDGDCDLLIELIFRQVNDDKMANHLLNLLAWNVQHPGKPPSQYIVLVSTRGRTGKTLLMEGVYKPIFGRWGTKIRRDDLTARFNGWVMSQFVFMEEVFATGNRGLMIAESNVLKDLATADQIMCEEKNRKAFPIKKAFMMAFTSNNLDCLSLGEYDRKAFVVGYGETDPAPPGLVESVAREWLPSGGPGKFLRLLRRRDLTGFDPRMDAPQTRERALMIELGRSSVEQFVRDLRDNWKEVIGSDCPYVTPDEVANVFVTRTGEEASRGLGMSIAKCMIKAGIPGYGLVKIEGRPLRIYDLSCGHDRAITQVIATARKGRRNNGKF